MWLVVSPQIGNTMNADEYQLACKHVIPIGYQPFNRCKAQHAYMMLGIDDLYLDEQFDKAKFRLDEEFCEWIYEEMDRGKKIYPNQDVPDIGKYISKIAHTTIFSNDIFQFYCRKKGYGAQKSKALKELLELNGFYIIDKELSIITKDELKQLNEKYSLEDALKIANVNPKAKPMIVITG